jgi:hypothetical protein
MAGSYFMTGGVIGKRLLITDTERYIIGETSEDVRFAPTYVGGRTQTSTSTSNITVTLTGLTGGSDTAPVEGDLVLVVRTWAGTADQSLTTSSTGWTELVETYFNSTYDINMAIYWKIMGATPDTSMVVNGQGSTNDATAIAVQVYRGVDTTTPFDVTYTSASSTSSGIPNPPAITPVTENSIIVAAAGTAHNGGTDTFTASELSNFITVGSNSTNDATVGIGWYPWETGSFNPAAWTFSQTDATTFTNSSVTMALRPKLTTVTTPVYGNQKNSGIWNLRASFRGSLVSNPIGIVDHSITASDGTTTVTSLNVTVPLDVVTGDLLVILCGNDSNTTTAQWNDTTLKPTGFTLINQISTDVADACCAAFYKVADGSEGGTTINVPAQSTQDMWAGCLVVRHADTASPIYGIGTNYDNASASSHSIPGVAALADTMMVFVASMDGSDTAPYTISAGEPDDFIQTAAGNSSTSVGGGFGWKFIDTTRTTLNQTVVFGGAGGADGMSGFQFIIKGV